MDAPHDVFWGSHACKRRRGHGNPCICVCGGGPDEDTRTYGDDEPVRRPYSGAARESPRRDSRAAVR